MLSEKYALRIVPFMLFIGKRYKTFLEAFVSLLLLNLKTRSSPTSRPAFVESDITTQARHYRQSSRHASPPITPIITTHHHHHGPITTAHCTHHNSAVSITTQHPSLTTPRQQCTLVSTRSTAQRHTTP